MSGILVLQLKRIGDAVLTAAPLASLRARHSQARIALVLSGVCGEMAGLFPMVDEVLVWRPGRMNARVLAAVARGGWDAVLDFSGNDRSALLSLLSRAPSRAGYAKFSTNKLRQKAWTALCDASVRDLHTVDFHQALVQTLWPDAPAQEDSGHLQLCPDTVLPRLPQGYLLLHPGTAREEKYWLAVHWAEIMQRMQALAVPVVVTGGTGDYEQEHLASIRKAGGVFADVSGKLSLTQLAGVIAGAGALVSVDTGVMHLASAFRIPQVALFGPTNPWHWAPRHSRALILHGATWCRGLPEKSGTATAAGYREMMPKAPREEMADITPAAVMAALTGVLGA